MASAWSSWDRRYHQCGAAALLMLALGLAAPAAAGAARPSAAPQHSRTPPPGLLTEAAAMALARATGQPVEVSALTSETTLVIADPATGLFRAEVSALPVRVRDDAATGWRPVDLTLHIRPDGRVGPAVAPVELVFSGGGTAALAQVADRGRWVELRWPGRLPTPVLSGFAATYPDVLPGVDLVLEAGLLGFSQSLVVKSREAASSPALAAIRFTVTSSGAALSRNAEGGLRGVDEHGRELFTGPPPRMWDSGSENARSALLGMQLSGSTLTVLPDRRLLSDPATRFPVVIDPAVSANPRYYTYWTMVWSDGQKFPNNTTEHARVGYDGWSSAPKRSRVFYRFDTAGFAGKHIISAEFAHKQIHSPNHDCSLTSFGPGVQLYRTGSISSSTAWSAQPSWAQLLSTSTVVHGHEDYCAGYDRQEWNAEDGLEYAAAHSSATLTLGLKSADETDRDGWRKYDNVSSSYPVLTATYNTPPNVPSNVKVADPPAPCATSSTTPAIINDSTPKLQATLTDPNGSYAELRGHFEVYDGSTEVYDFVNGSEYVSGTTVTTTTTSLTNGKAYKWRVRAEEYIAESTDVSGWYPSNTGFCYLKVDTSAPPMPAVSSTAYPEFDPDNQVAYGAEGQPGAFTFTAGATDVTAYLYRVNAGQWLSKATSGGAAVTVTIVPDAFGVNQLHVYTRDSAGNVSSTREYDFLVARGRAPVAVWNLDETSGTTASDSSGNGYSATLSGPVWGGVARSGGSLSLDGTDDYAATAGPVVDTTKSFTVAAWVRLDQTSSNQTILSQAGSLAAGFQLYHSSTYGWVFNRHATDTTNPTIIRARSAYTPMPYVWTHLAGVYDATNQQIKLYVNGVLDATLGTASFTTPWNATGPLTIGRLKYNGGYQEYLDGKVDQVQVWDRVAGADEIAELVHLVDPVSGLARPALIGQWKLDETAGTMADDATPYNKDLTLQAGAAWAVDPERGNVLRLDGGSTGWATASGRQIDATGSFTLTAWVKPTNPADNGIVLAAPGTYENSYQVELGGTGLWSYYRHAQDASGSSWTKVASDDTAESGVWTHLAVVYDAPAQRMLLYVNGVRQGAEGGVPYTTAWQTAKAINVGWAIDNGAPHVAYAAEGLYDDIRVYAGVMSPQDIYLLFATT